MKLHAIVNKKATYLGVSSGGAADDDDDDEEDEDEEELDRFLAGGPIA
jgi:hypothetical protein